MRFRFVFLLVVLLVWVPVSAGDPSETTNVPVFQLVNERDTPLSDARVTVLGRSSTAQTDEDGLFRLTPFPALPFVLVVFDGSGRIIGKVTVELLAPDRVSGVVRLVLKPAQVEAVTVIGGAAPSTNSTPAAAVDVFTRQELERKRPSRIVETLESVPGAENSGSGQTAVPAIRGLARGRTLVLLDGARVTTERRAGASATYLDPFSLEAVELVRGPGSVAYGSDALGGVLHARTLRPTPDETATRLEVGIGTGLPYGSVALDVNLPAGDSSAIRVQAHQRYFDNYDTPDGEEPNSSARDRGGLIRGRTSWLKGDLQVGMQFDEAIDVERPASNTDTRRTQYPLERSARLNAEWNRAGLSGWFPKLGVELFLGGYSLVTRRDDDLVAASQVAISDVSANDFSVRVTGERNGAAYRLKAGVDLNGRFDLHALDSVELIPEAGPGSTASSVSIDDARRLDTGLYLEGGRKLKAGRWNLSGGLRLDSITTSNRGGTFGDRSTSNQNISGFAATRWHPGNGKTGISLQVARGFRDPSLSSRYFQGTTARGMITGNPDLNPETSLQFDLAVRTRLGATGLAVYAYHYQIRDLIERYEIVEDQFSFRNRDELNLRGLEVEADFDLAGRWTAQAMAGWARGELTDGSHPNDVPTATTGLTVQRGFGESGWFRLGALYRFRDDQPGATEQVVPAHLVLDGAVGWDPSERWSIRLILRNLADREHLDSADRRAPMAIGRAASVVLTGRF